MALLRHNVIDLIGAHTGRYHSAIITCYSFDFLFFEERILPALRRSNIKNIVVFADGNFIEKLLENKTGREFASIRTYSLNLIYSKHVFHPKIMLLVGKKQGLLLTGSGNLTASGLSCNDEIWAAFHLEDHTLPHAGLFSQTWEYLKRFFPHLRGFSLTQMDWFTRYAPWLNQLPLPAESTWNILPSGDSALTIHNQEKSIFDQLSSIISTNLVKEITVISPYFDQDGQALLALQERFQPEQMNCLVDPQSDLLPEQLLNSSLPVQFYDWSVCTSDFDKEKNRLHAKAFHFLMKDGTQFLLLGSANATAPGLGIGGKTGWNEEACILINRTSGLHFLEELGIKYKTQTVLDPHTFKRLRPTHSQGAGTSPRLVRILHVELMEHELVLYLKWTEGHPLKEIQIHVQDQWDDMIVAETIPAGNGIVKIILPKVEIAYHTVQLYGDAGMPISGKALIHRVDLLSRCNPDPALAKLSEALEKANREGEDGLAQLFELLDYSWADEDESSNQKSRSAGFGTFEASIHSGKSDYAKLSPEEFNSVSKVWEEKLSAHLNDQNYQVADFLAAAGSRLRQIGDNNEGDNQELMPDDPKADTGEGSAVTSSKRQKVEGLVIQHAIIRFLHKLIASYFSHLTGFYTTKNVNELPAQMTTIKQISNLQISLRLFQIYCGVKFKVKEGTEDEKSKTIEKLFLKLSGSWDSADNLKFFLIEGLGRFLLCCIPGDIDYQNEVLQNRLQKQRKVAFAHALFWILNCPWTERDRYQAELLYLNALYFLCPDYNSNQEWLKNLEQQVEHYRKDAKIICPIFEENWGRFKGSTLPEYARWLPIFKDNETRMRELVIETAQIRKEQIIFNSKLGFNRVYNYRFSEQKTHLSLVRPGYDWDEDCQGFVVRDLVYGGKVVVYR